MEKEKESARARPAEAQPRIGTKKRGIHIDIALDGLIRIHR